MSKDILNRVALVASAFPMGGVAQQLLDRFLAGYPRDGSFGGRLASGLVLHGASPDDANAARRRKDFGLELPATMAEAVKNSTGVVVVGDGLSLAPPPEMMETVLNAMPEGASCFVAGILAPTADGASRWMEVASRRGIRLGSGGLMSVIPRLPESWAKPGHRPGEVLIVVQGDDSQAKADGVLGLLGEFDPTVAQGDAGRVRRYEQDAVWRAARKGEWAWDLLAAALSRTSNPQGDSVTDGRTQDLVGLGMVQRLALHPRCWVTDHVGGVRSAILALDGVVKDVNLAVRGRDGVVASTQLFRPPAPNDAGYGRLAGVIEDFLRGGELPWPLARGVAVAGWMDALGRAA